MYCLRSVDLPTPLAPRIQIIGADQFTHCIKLLTKFMLVVLSIISCLSNNISIRICFLQKAKIRKICSIQKAIYVKFCSIQKAFPIINSNEFSERKKNPTKLVMFVASPTKRRIYLNMQSYKLFSAQTFSKTFESYLADEFFCPKTCRLSFSP